MSFKALSRIDKFLLKKKNPRGYNDYKMQLAYSKAPVIDFNVPAGPEVHFKHSGNSGDVIYALPSIYALAGSNKIFIHLNAGKKVVHEKGVYHPLGDVMLNEKVIHMLQPLLAYQSRISKVDQLTNQHIDVDLDLFRSFPLFKGQGNIARWYFYIFAIQADLSKPWLEAPVDEKFKDRIVIARSHRYRNPGIDYGFLSRYGAPVFVGLKEEYEDMKKSIPHLEYAPVHDFLEMATIIHSSKLFIGNQSFPFAIAEGLKTKRVLEVCYYCPNVNVEGPDGFDFCYQPQFEKIVERALAHGHSSR